MSRQRKQAVKVAVQMGFDWNASTVYYNAAVALILLFAGVTEQTANQATFAFNVIMQYLYPNLNLSVVTETTVIRKRRELQDKQHVCSAWCRDDGGSKLLKENLMRDGPLRANSIEGHSVEVISRDSLSRLCENFLTVHRCIGAGPGLDDSGE